MSELSEYKKGDWVFVTHSTDKWIEEWIGVELLQAPNWRQRDQIKAKIIYTGGIPGYEIGAEIELNTNALAYKELTVRAIINHRDGCEA